MQCEAGSAAHDRVLMIGAINQGPCRAGLALLGHIDEKFVDVVDVYEPLESGQRDKCFISKGCAACPACSPSSDSGQTRLLAGNVCASNQKPLLLEQQPAIEGAQCTGMHQSPAQGRVLLGPARCRWHAGVRAVPSQLNTPAEPDMASVHVQIRCNLSL